MLIYRVSTLTSAGNVMELDIDPEAYATWASGFGPVIQEAFPHLTPSEREFLMTGITPKEWTNLFGAENSES